jgi:hypothetical protein
VSSKWEDLERWLEGQRLPKGFERLREPDWVEKFVRHMMIKAMPGVAASAGFGQSPAEVFETHHFVIVKFPLPADAVPERLRLLVREDRLRLEGLPGDERKTIKLPRAVRPRMSRALLREGVLQVKLRKKPVDPVYEEIPIRW